jgi:predicted RNA-binding Zn ribbon-like protein
MDIPEDLVGGVAAIDFSNCVSRLDSTAYTDRYRFLLEWSRRRGSLDSAQVRRLSGEAERRPADLEEVAVRALQLARATCRILSGVACGRPPSAEDLAVLNWELSLALPRLRVEPGSRGFGWRWDADDSPLDRVLWPVARSAAELLVSEDLDRVKVCASDTCTWLFLDTTRNRQRRWCDMKVCGNREKARRHRASKGPPPED